MAGMVVAARSYRGSPASGRSEQVALSSGRRDWIGPRHLNRKQNSEARGNRRPARGLSVRTLATVQGREGAAAAELDLGGPIAAETARRLSCEAGVTRVVFGADSAVIDVGRSTRVPATATRRAVQARDRGCVWPGCHGPASWGEVHHLRHWAQGGATDIANLVTICRDHH
jgi:hypothetical protein